MKPEEVYGFILKMKQVILMLMLQTVMILNLLSRKLIIGRHIAPCAPNQDGGILKF